MIDALILLGLSFLTLGVTGLLKFSNAMNRMHATSKASTLGVGFTVLAGAVKFYPDGVYLSSVLVLIFMFMTAPTGAHMIARATYNNKETENKTLDEFLD
jgi:multicomponent Na+:H+ antiporter subunit G